MNHHFKGQSEPLAVRVGIASGIVLIADNPWVEHYCEKLIYGETPILAARLQQIAEPNSVVACDHSRHLIGSRLVMSCMGKVLLKGYSRPVYAWQVMDNTGVSEESPDYNGTLSFAGTHQTKFEPTKGKSLTDRAYIKSCCQQFTGISV